MKLNIPICITIIRILLIPFFIFTFYWNNLICGIIFFVSAITDWFDGFLARKLKKITHFGIFLDPVADKIMIVIALILIIDYFHKWWITFPSAIIIIREVIISALREWLARMQKQKMITVSVIAKIKTTLQIVAVCILLWHPNFLLELVGICILYIACIFTFLSMLQYLRKI